MTIEMQKPKDMQKKPEEFPILPKIPGITPNPDFPLPAIDPEYPGIPHPEENPKEFPIPEIEPEDWPEIDPDTEPEKEPDMKPN